MTSPAAELPTILLAEDDDLVRAIAEEMLGEAGYKIVAVGDGMEALKVLEQMTPDLIVSDVRMPRCDGFEFLQRVRRDPAYMAIPFIIMSAKAEMSDQRMGMSLGADDYVTKPYRAEDLLQTIAVRLERAARVKDLLSQQQRFLSVVLPHELRTPLTGIIGYADLMVNLGEAGEILSAADLLDFGRNLARAGHRLLGVANDLALWSWLEAWTIKVRSGEKPMRKPVRLTQEMIKNWRCVSAELYGREKDTLVVMEPAMVLAPGEGLERVVGHLIDNALKFSLPGSLVKATGRVAGLNYEIEVVDRGRGMSEAELAAIGLMRQFGRERFEQQGMGMGLVLARSFVQLGKGNFEMRRNLEGAGMYVRLTLPLPAAPEGEAGV